jgi:3-isopropylmalate/(R)-2-methylmalate dehydratase small subunit
MNRAPFVESVTFSLPVDNIDTDQIIPAQFLTTTEREGLGRYCFHGWRHDEHGVEHCDHPLKCHDPQRHQVLVAGRNFGCGSSREHAPWALLDFGFKAVISSQFADIFHSNALKNGLLPVVVEEHVTAFLHERPDHPVRIDIHNRTLTVEGYGEFEFPIDPFSAYCLTRGINPFEFLLENATDISRFEQERVRSSASA